MRNNTSAMARRADGDLKTGVLRALWNIVQPMSPSDVIKAVSSKADLTVMFAFDLFR